MALTVNNREAFRVAGVIRPRLGLESQRKERRRLSGREGWTVSRGAEDKCPTTAGPWRGQPRAGSARALGTGQPMGTVVRPSSSGDPQSLRTVGTRWYKTRSLEPPGIWGGGSGCGKGLQPPGLVPAAPWLPPCWLPPCWVGSAQPASSLLTQLATGSVNNPVRADHKAGIEISASIIRLCCKTQKELARNLVVPETKFSLGHVDSSLWSASLGESLVPLGLGFLRYVPGTGPSESSSVTGFGCLC